MSDAHLSTHLDSTITPPLMTDAQVGNAVATKFLNEIHAGMTGPPNSNDTGFATFAAEQDIAGLKGDPQSSAVLNTIAARTENHDPALGLVQGTVERDKSGAVTGFDFSNPERIGEYNQQLNDYMKGGYTQQEAQTALNVYVKPGMPAETGVLHMSVNNPYDQ